MPFDPTRLKSQLLNTGLQVKDNSLFQVINLLIDAVGRINTDVNNGGSSGGGGGGGGSVIVENNITELANSRIGYSLTTQGDKTYRNKNIYPPGNNASGIDFPLSPSKGGTGTSTVFTQGSVVFVGPNGVYAQDNGNFFWDDTNDRLGLGTNAPLVRLDIRGTSSIIQVGSAFDGANVIALNNVSTGTSCISRFQMATDTFNNVFVDGYGSNFSGNAVQRANGAAIIGFAPGGLALAAVDSSGFLTFHAGGLTEWLRLTTTGLLTFQGITSSFPALKRVGTQLQVRLADDSGGGTFGVGEFFTPEADTKLIIGAPNAGTAQLEFQADKGDNNADYAFIRKEDSGAGGNLIVSNAGFGNPSTPNLVVDPSGNVGIGLATITASLHIKAGTATANTAPLKFTAGTLLATPEIGAMEFTDDGVTAHLYITVRIAGVVTRVQIV